MADKAVTAVAASIDASNTEDRVLIQNRGSSILGGRLTLTNLGPNTVYLNVADAAVTTTNAEDLTAGKVYLPANASLAIPQGLNVFRIRCAAAETAKLILLGV